jgi:hypothetical protein
MSYTPQYDYPPRQNALAISAFVVSIVSLITCGVLSPIGLIMSVLALRREPRGLAIAGTIISCIGLLALLGIGGMTIYTAIKAGEVATAVGKSMETTAAIEMARIDIDAHARKHGDTLPDDATGAFAIRSQVDGWGNALRYRRVDQSNYELASAGPDGVFGNTDDRSYTYSSNSLVPGTGPSPSDTAAATTPALLH